MSISRSVLRLAIVAAAIGCVAFAQTMNESIARAGAEVTRGRLMSALAILEPAVQEAEARKNAADVRVLKTFSGYVHDRLAIAMYELGNYAVALSHDEISLRIARELGERDAEVSALISLSTDHFAMGQYDSALTALTEASHLSETLGRVENESLIASNLGLFYLHLGEHARALSSFNKALALYTQVDNKRGAAVERLHLGTVYHALGAFDRAVASYSAAANEFKAIDDVRGMEFATNSLAALSLEQGDLKQARSLYARVIASFEQTVAEVRREYDTRTRDSDPRLRRYDLGSLLPAIFGRQYPSVQSAKLGIAETDLKEGRSESAFEVFTSLRALIGIGRVHLEARRYYSAIDAFTESAAVDEKSADASRHTADRIGIGLALEGLGRLPAAGEQYQRAVSLIDREFAALAAGERRSFFASSVEGFPRLAPFEGMVRVAFQQDRRDDAFYWSEQTKTRAFLDAIGRGVEPFGGQIGQELAQTEDRLQSRLAELERRRAAAIQAGDKNGYVQLTNQWDGLNEEHRTLIARLRDQAPAFAAVRYPQPLRAGEVTLSRNEVLIAYEVTTSATFVFAVRDGKVVRAIRVGISREELEDLVRGYRRTFDQAGRLGTLEPLAGLDVAKGRRLYDLLLKDALAEVSPTEHVLLVPDETLSFLPFEALIESVPSGSIEWVRSEHGSYPKDVVYVGDRRVITYWQSASSLVTLRHLAKQPAGVRMLAITDPVFSPADERLTTTSEASTTRPRTDEFGLRRQTAEGVSHYIGIARFGRLPSTLRMANRLRGIFGDQLEVWEGLQATESRLKRQPLAGYGFGIVFATHGLVDERVPYLQQAALVLTNPELTGETGEDDDGFLSMSEVMNLELATELVAALACQTGIGGVVKGEGVMHLGRAFQFAGARSVLMSLWNVEDESTNILGERVLRGMKQGESKDVALLAARKELREQGYEHPFYWAAFILMGERDVQSPTVQKER